jgi:hypothetical protein
MTVRTAREVPRREKMVGGCSRRYEEISRIISEGRRERLILRTAEVGGFIVLGWRLVG